MLTTIQEAIAVIDRMIDKTQLERHDAFSDGHYYAYRSIKLLLEAFLIKEKEAIEQAFDDGHDSGHMDTIDTGFQYYNKTFKQ
jgi:hypothetical protein